MKPSPRRKARELAVQAIYSWQISQNSVTDIEVNFIADNSKRRFDIEYFQLLLRGVTTNLSDIDDAISIEYHLSNKSLLTIGVHIANPTDFLDKKTILDRADTMVESLYPYNKKTSHIAKSFNIKGLATNIFPAFPKKLLLEICFSIENPFKFYL